MSKVKKSDFGVNLPSGIPIDEATEAIITAASNLVIVVAKVDEFHIAGGGFADIWHGELGNGDHVALKVARVMYQGPRLYKMLSREVNIWSQLKHRNVLPFLGVSLRNSSTPLALVSPWMMHGHVNNYLTESPDADRLHLIRGIGHGLSYLHGIDIVHGDLKGANILVDSSGEPLLADFGLSFILDELDKEGHGQTTSTAFAGSSRWKAPERFVPERYHLSQSTSRRPPSDIYSLGMTIYEIMSGHVPFEGIGDIRASFLVVEGRRPKHPGVVAMQRGLHDKLWSFVLQSWEAEPSCRPSISALEAALTFAPETLSPVDRLTQGSWLTSPLDNAQSVAAPKADTKVEDVELEFSTQSPLSHDDSLALWPILPKATEMFGPNVLSSHGDQGHHQGSRLLPENQLHPSSHTESSSNADQFHLPNKVPPLSLYLASPDAVHPIPSSSVVGQGKGTKRPGAPGHGGSPKNRIVVSPTSHVTEVPFKFDGAERDESDFLENPVLAKPFSAVESSSAVKQVAHGSRDVEAGESEGYNHRLEALFAYTGDPSDPNELSFAKGEVMYASGLKGEWWEARKADGTIGIVPSNYVRTESEIYKHRIEAMYSYSASPDDPNEISFVRGQVMHVRGTTGKWWLAQKADGTIGIVPSNYVRLSPESPS